MNSKIETPLPVFHPPNPKDFGLDPGEIEELKKRRDIRLGAEQWENELSGCAMPIIIFGTVVICLFFSNYALINAPWLFLAPIGGVILLALIVSIISGLIKMVPKRIRVKLSALEKYEKEYEKIKSEHEAMLKKCIEDEERKKQHELQLKLEYWYSLSGVEFENEIAKLFRRGGYKVQTTPVTGDNGIDLILDKEGEKIIVQCKAHKKPVGPAIVRELYGTLRSQIYDNYTIAHLVTISGATSGARSFAKDHDILIWDIRNILYYVEEWGPNNANPTKKTFGIL